MYEFGIGQIVIFDFLKVAIRLGNFIRRVLLKGNNNFYTEEDI